MMKILILVSILYSFSAQAEITDLTVSGGSKFDENPVTTVWGVFAGGEDLTLRTPYNSCNISTPDNTFGGCHPKRINGNTDITIRFRETTEFTNKHVLITIDTGDQDDRIVFTRTTGGDIVNSQTQEAFISFTWEDVCNALSSPDGNPAIGTDSVSTLSACVVGGIPVSGSLKLRIGIESGSNTGEHLSNSAQSIDFNIHSADSRYGIMPASAIGVNSQGCGSNPEPTPPDTTPINYGFCDISIIPGDQGGFLNTDTNINPDHFNQTFASSLPINALTSESAEPVDISAAITQLRLYFTPVNAATGVSDTSVAKFVDFNTTISGSIASFEDNGFSGIINGVLYYFRAATIDDSGTVSQLFDKDVCPEPITLDNCPYTFVPSEVAGIITESSCFITTATYGSTQAYQVKLFQNFREKFLWSNWLGLKIIKAYNTFGPKGAKWINKHPASKPFVRILLYPFYGFAYLSLHFGFLFAAITYLFGLVVLTLGLTKLKPLSRLKAV